MKWKDDSNSIYLSQSYRYYLGMGTAMQQAKGRLGGFANGKIINNYSMRVALLMQMGMFSLSLGNFVSFSTQCNGGVDHTIFSSQFRSRTISVRYVNDFDSKIDI